MRDFRLRTGGPEDHGTLWALFEHAFGADPNPADAPMAQAELAEASVLVAEEGDQIIGVALTVPGPMCLPGGVVEQVHKVTGVAVRADRRRRGVLTALMRRQLSDFHDAGGPPLAALFASEAPIYGRFGYACAAPVLSYTIPRPARLAGPETTGTEVDLVEVTAALPDARQLSADLLATRAGRTVPLESFLTWLAADPDHHRRGASALRAVLARDATGVTGFAFYRTQASWQASRAAGELSLVRLEARTPAASAALWSHVLGVDLMARVNAAGRPPDDEVLSWLGDPRLEHCQLLDGLWLRLVDVPRALAARGYLADARIVLELDDPICPWNSGRWALETSATGASCVPTAEPADLALDVSTLAAAYLGATSLASRHAAGWVDERRPGALAVAARAFLAERPPWCNWGF